MDRMTDSLNTFKHSVQYRNIRIPYFTKSLSSQDREEISLSSSTERYKAKNLEGILELTNKVISSTFKSHLWVLSLYLKDSSQTPVWNDETQSYVLNFHGRVTQVQFSKGNLKLETKYTKTMQRKFKTESDEETWKRQIQRQIQRQRINFHG